MTIMKKCFTTLMATVVLTIFTVQLLPNLTSHSPPFPIIAPITAAFAAESSQNHIDGQSQDMAVFSGRALPLLRRLREIQGEKVEQLEKNDTDWIKVFELNVEAAKVITQLEKTAKQYGIPPYIDHIEALIKSTDSRPSDPGAEPPR